MRRPLRLARTSAIYFFIAVSLILCACDKKPSGPNQPPHAVLTITPIYGVIDSIFILDASGSFDKQDKLTSLSLRWDFETDGNWDIDWSWEPVQRHQFPAPGKVKVTLEVRDSSGSISRASQEAFAIGAPEPDLSITPEIGSTETTFHFDASLSSDGFHSPNDLLLRWDFDGDGTWDNPWGNSLEVDHRYPQGGLYHVTLEVKNPLNQIGQLIQDWEVGAQNTPPVAVVTMDRDVSNVIESFTFYFSQCHDAESLLESLRFCIDKNGDGIIDINWFSGTAIHVDYQSKGSFEPIFVVRDPEGATDTTSVSIVVENLPPDAHYNLTESAPIIDGLIMFNAGYSSDPDDILTNLEVRWDFEPDGIWDFDWSYEKVVTHAYENRGIYHPRLEVRDAEGASDSASTPIHVTPPILWKTYLGGNIDGLLALSPDGSTIYASSAEGTLYAVDLSGFLQWSYYYGGYVHFGYPAVGDNGVIYVPTAGEGLHAINPDGSVKWVYNPGNLECSDAALGNDGTVYIGVTERICALDPSDGSLEWEFVHNGTRCSVVVAPDSSIVFGPGDKGLYCLTPQGEEKWHITGFPIMYVPPSIAEDGTIYIEDGAAYVHAISKDGVKLWSTHCGGSDASTPLLSAGGSIVVMANTIRVLDRNGVEQWQIPGLWNNPFGHPLLAADGSVLFHKVLGLQSGEYSFIYRYDASGTWMEDWLSEKHCHMAPMITPGGMICFGTDDGYLVSVPAGSVKYSTAEWPRYRADNQNSGRRR